MAEEIVAPLSGKIVELHLQLGAKVEEDDEALVIEALKMENPVYVPCNGTVKEVKVTVGQQVEEDDVLAIIE
ncbi:MAG: acetyl-CoA carboxylase biotin carboxyl carrier protein subunit [bacterium]